MNEALTKKNHEAEETSRTEKKELTETAVETYAHEHAQRKMEQKKWEAEREELDEKLLWKITECKFRENTITRLKDRRKDRKLELKAALEMITSLKSECAELTKKLEAANLLLAPAQAGRLDAQCKTIKKMRCEMKLQEEAFLRFTKELEKSRETSSPK